MFAECTDLLLEAADRLVHVTTSPLPEAAIYGVFADGSVYSLRRENASLEKFAKPLVTNATIAAAHPFLNLVAVGCGSGIVYLAEEGVEPVELAGHVSEVIMLKWVAMGRALAIGDASGRVQVFEFDPATRQTQLIAKLLRKGKPVCCFERTACTQNFYINIPAPDSMDKLAWMIGNVPLELLVGFDCGDVICIEEKGGHEVVCTIPTGLFKLFYWAENDTGAAISPSGDLVTFGFESVNGRAKRVNLSKSKLEFSVANGVCQLGNCKLAYVATTGGEVKIIDIFTEVAQIIEIDDYIESFTSVNGELQFIDGLGIVFGIKGQPDVIIISEKDTDGAIERFSADAYNASYLHLLDTQLEDSPDRAGEERSGKATYTVRDAMRLNGEFPDVFLRFVQNDACDPENPAIFATSRAFKHPADGSAQPYVLLEFKKPVTAAASQINSSLLEQSLNGEALVSKTYLESGFVRARNLNCEAVQVDQRSIKVYAENETFMIGTSHDIEKLCIILTANEKSGYLLAYGCNTFSTFEISFGTAPQLIETFELPVDDYEIHDVALFGRHIIASVNQRFSATDPQRNKSDILRMTMNGTVSATLPVNYQQDGKGNVGLKMCRIQIVNFHLFMVSNQQSLYYTDMKNFSRVVEVAKLSKDYVLSEENVIKAGPDGTGPEISISQAMRQSFNLSSLLVSGFNATCTLESIEYVNMCFEFSAFNDLLGRFVQCPFCLCLQVNVSELFEAAQSQIDTTTTIKNSRLIDFAPHKIINAQIDAFDNVVAETEATNNYMFLLIGFSSAIIRRYCIFHREMLLFDNCVILKQIMEQITDYAEADQENGDESVMMNGLDAMLILQFLSVRIENSDRERIIQRHTDLNRECAITSIQGVFPPYVIPKVESQSTFGTLLQFISPAIVSVARDGFKSTQLADSLRNSLSLRILSIPSLTPQDPFAQSPKTTYTMAKFIVSVQNNRFNDAYQFVAKFDSVEIWRTLAQLCVKNGYIELLRTCISHLKSPMVSLILRGENSQETQSAQQISKIESSNRDEEMAALLSISLGDIGTGMSLVSNKPLLNAKIMQEVGLGAFNLSEQAFKETTGFHAITRKAAVYGLANRLYRMGDYAGANCCYEEIFEGENVYVSDLTSQKRRVSAEEEQEAIKSEFESNGPQAASLLAKKMNTVPALYRAAALIENKAYDDQDESLLFDAAQLYNLANCKTHALQCAIECDTEDLIYNIGASGGPRVALQAAGYFARKCNESDENMQRALLLYSGAGYTGEAVELCIQIQRVKELAALLNELLSGLRRDDPVRVSNELLQKAGGLLVNLKQEDYALDDYNSYVKTGLLALAHAGATDEALQVIASGQVLITEEIADLLTPGDPKAADNIDIISTIGKLLFKAELYEQAVQKFILIGDSYLALNALIKLGNVEKVVKFAQMSRDRKCFVAAGNFLQTQNFRDNLQYMTWIIEFYEKAGALDNLIKFFVNCAAEEIDVFNDYEKAMEALREAAKWIGKNIQSLQGQQENAETVAKLQEDKALVERNGKLIMGFLNLIEYAKNNLNEADSAETLTANAKKLMSAVNEFDECMVQIPHILAFMCEFHAQRGENARVLQILKNMVNSGFDVVKYVDEAVLEQFADELGLGAAQAAEDNPENVEESAGGEEEDVELDIVL